MTEENTTPTEPKPRAHDTVQPVFLHDLCQAAGIVEAARKIGVSVKTINQYFADNACKKSIELAAEFVWMRDYGLPKGNQTAIVQCDAKNMEIIASIVERWGGTITPLKV